MNKTKIQRIIIGLIIGSITSLIVYLVTMIIWTGVFDAFEHRSLDIRCKARIKYLWEKRNGAPIDDIFIIDIDNRSLEKLGQFNQWPRSYHAQLVDYVASSGALAIGFDILFLEPERDSNSDSTFVESVNANLNVYNAISFSAADANSFLYAMDGPPEGLDTDKFSIKLGDKTTAKLTVFDRFDGKLTDLYNASSGIGYANFTPDNDSVIRTMPLFITFAGRQYPSFSLSMALGILGANLENVEMLPGKHLIIHPPGTAGKTDIVVPLDKKSKILINYQGTFQTFRYISYYDVLMQRVPKELFNGKIVLIGTSAAGLSDIRPVPFQDAYPGVEIHATIIHNILSQQFIKKQNTFFILLYILLLCCLTSLAGIFFKPWQGLIVTTLLLLIIGFTSLFLFSHFAYWLSTIRPIIGVVLSFLFIYVFRYIDEEKNKMRLKSMFQHYLTASVVDQMMKNPELLKLGGDRRYATALFSDIESFTTLAENMSPEVMVSHLNEYLTAMTRIILKYEGYLDKYEGDAIMAIFGIPIEQPDHAQRACMAAIEMQQALVKLREQWRAQNKPEFQVRIGINTGNMIAGNIGGTERFDYTVIGDSVNLASRLEGANKIYRSSILISEYTNNHLTTKLNTRELDQIRVKGKTKPVRVFELYAFESQTPEWQDFLALYHKAVELYRVMKWKDAMEQFKLALTLQPEDYPAKMYCKRCTYYIKNPVDDDWDGIFDIDTK